MCADCARAHRAHQVLREVEDHRKVDRDSEDRQLGVLPARQARAVASFQSRVGGGVLGVGSALHRVLEEPLGSEVLLVLHKPSQPNRRQQQRAEEPHISPVSPSSRLCRSLSLLERGLSRWRTRSCAVRQRLTDVSESVSADCPLPFSFRFGCMGLAAVPYLVM